MATMDNLLSARQFAEKMGICLRTLDTLQKHGRLPASLRIGRARRWRSIDVDEWVQKKLGKGGGSEKGITSFALERSQGGVMPSD